MSRIVDQIIADAHAHEFTPQEARWVRIEAAARAVLDAYADPLVQSVGDSPVLVDLRAALDDDATDTRHETGWTRMADKYKSGYHTQGQWDQDATFPAEVWAAGRSTPIAVVNPARIGHGPEDLANMRLILDAPNLLASCRVMVDIVTQFRWAKDCDWFRDTQTMLARHPRTA